MKKAILKTVIIGLMLFYNNIHSRAQSASKIMFLSFKIYKERAGQDFSIKLLDKIIVDGTIKKESGTANLTDQLVFSVLDDKQKVTKTIAIDNPLSNSIESFEPDGKIQRHPNNADSTEFTLRFQYQATMKKVTLSRQINNRTQSFSNFSIEL